MKQNRNDEMLELLRAEVQFRYEPQFAWKSSVSQFLALLGLRGFWPTSSVSGGGSLMDLSGQNRILTLNGGPFYRRSNLAPVVVLDGAADFFTRADEAGLDITGTESYIVATRRGLTLGGWFNFTNVAGATEHMMGKWDQAGNQRSYSLRRNAAGNIVFAISTDGTAVVEIASTDMPAQATWFWAAGRFDAATQELDVWVNDAVDNLAVGVPASIHIGTADLVLGGRHGGLSLMAGMFSMPVLCAASLPDAIEGQTYQQSRAMFGV